MFHFNFLMLPRTDWIWREYIMVPISFAYPFCFTHFPSFLTSEPAPRSNKQTIVHQIHRWAITLTKSCSILIFWCYRGLTEFGVSNGADIICVSCSFHKRIEMRFQTNLAWTNMQIMQSRYDLRRSSIPPQKPSLRSPLCKVAPMLENRDKECHGC